MILYHLVDDIAEKYLDLIDDLNDEIDELEENVEVWPAERIRGRLSELRHDILHIRGDGHIETDAEVATASGKSLVNEQPALFAELDEDQWRSTASVSPRKTLSSFSDH